MHAIKFYTYAPNAARMTDHLFNTSIFFFWIWIKMFDHFCVFIFAKFARIVFICVLMSMTMEWHNGMPRLSCTRQNKNSKKKKIPTYVCLVRRRFDPWNYNVKRIVLIGDLWFVIVELVSRDFFVPRKSIDLHFSLKKRFSCVCVCGVRLPFCTFCIQIAFIFRMPKQKTKTTKRKDSREIIWKKTTNIDTQNKWKNNRMIEMKWNGMIKHQAIELNRSLFYSLCCCCVNEILYHMRYHVWLLEIL